MANPKVKEPSLATRLGLGTVQFGLPYGIANQSGQPSIDEVRKILEVAQQNGIRLLDTAHLYGDSEEVLGLSGLASEFQIITKTPRFSSFMAQGTHGERLAGEALRTALEESCRRMRVPSVEGLLFHDSADLIGPLGVALWTEARRLQAEGQVRKIGVSVYDPSQIRAVFSRIHPELIQAPINLFDQRFLKGGLLDELNQKGIEIHARSIFLQGTLLMERDAVPRQLRQFEPNFINYHAVLRRLGLAPFDAALGFVLNLPQISRLIVGVERSSQLLEILDKMSRLPSDLDLRALEQLSCDNEMLIVPTNWPKPD